MKSIYMDECWGVLQEPKEEGKAQVYTLDIEGAVLRYPFIKRYAGMVDGIRYYDLVTPRGECGPWIEGGSAEKRREVVERFSYEFDRYCQREGIIAEYIRFNPWLENHREFSQIYNTSFYGYIYCNDLRRNFFEEEYKSSKRRNIRKAMKSGIRIEIDGETESIEEFLRLYRYTAEKYSMGPYYTLDREFLLRYFKYFKGNVVVVKGVYEERVVSAAIILMGRDIAHYHFAANDPDYVHLQGNSLVIYEASNYAAVMGRKLFDLGGAKSGSELERYKRGYVYGGRLYSYEVGTKIRNPKIYDALVERNGFREGYFPAYRH